LGCSRLTSFDPGLILLYETSPPGLGIGLT
jgi:hypothetical protein